MTVFIITAYFHISKTPIVDFIFAG